MTRRKRTPRERNRPIATALRRAQAGSDHIDLSAVFARKRRTNQLTDKRFSTSTFLGRGARALGANQPSSAQSPSSDPRARTVTIHLPTYCPVHTRAVMRAMTEIGCEHRRRLAQLVSVMRELHDANKEDIPRLRGIIAEIHALSGQLCPLADQVFAMWPEHISDEEIDEFLAEFRAN